MFIILDGLDEADLTIKDRTDRRERTEMTILFQRLAKLPSTRLLFLSRPSAKIGDAIPNLPTKHIDISENRQDIENYVRDFINNESRRLSKFFENEHIDPIQYFHDKSNGIFLWVVLVLQQLEKAKTRNIFRDRLNGFSDASGSMENLYKKILERVEKEDVKWIREIIRWVIVAKTPLTVSSLQAVVEFCLEDEHQDFKSFVEVECGSILNLLAEDEEVVQLVHETFRSFIFNKSKMCPPQFWIIEESSHGYVALQCLKDLRSNDGPKFVTRYGALEWPEHLAKSSSNQTRELLTSLNQFFTSDVKMWLSACLPAVKHWHPWGVPTEYFEFQTILRWIWNAKARISHMSELGENLGLDEFICLAQEAFGKAMVQIWLESEASFDYGRNRQLFRTGLGCYWKRSSGSTDDIDMVVDGKSLQKIMEWAERPGQRPRDSGSTGLAYYTLHNWEECIRCLKNHDDILLQRYLGMAFMAMGDYKGAITTFKKIVIKEPDNYCWFQPGLLDAYLSIQSYDEAIEVFQEANKKHPQLHFLRFLPGYIYVEQGNFQKAIEAFDAEGIRLDYPWERIWDVGTCAMHLLSGDYGPHKFRDTYTFNYAVGDYDRAIQMTTDAGGRRVAAYIAQGNADAAEKEILSKLVEDSNLTSWHRRELIECLVQVVRHGNAKTVSTILCESLERCRREPEKNGKLLGPLIEAYHAGKEYSSLVVDSKNIQSIGNLQLFGEAINCLLDACYINENFRGDQVFLEPVDSSSLHFFAPAVSYRVIEFLGSISEYQKAEEISLQCVRHNPSSSWSWCMLGQSYKMKGDYVAAIATYRAALRAIPNDYSFYKELGDIYQLHNKYQDAIDAFQNLIEKAAPAQRGSLLYAYLGRPCEQGYATIDDRFGEHFLWLSLGNARKSVSASDNRVFEEAIHAYQTALEQSTPPILHWEYSELKIDFGEFNPFHKRRCLRKSALWSALGKAYQAIDDARSAAGAYQNALSLEPNNPWLRNTLFILKKNCDPSEDSYVEEENLEKLPIRKEVRIPETRAFSLVSIP